MPTDAAPTTAPTAPPTLLSRYLAWRRPLEIAFWCTLLMAETVMNAITVRMDLARSGVPAAAWEPWLWEASSHLAWGLLLPLMLWIEARRPLTRALFLRHLPWHLAAAFGISLLHVAGMSAVRALVYASHGLRYDPGPVMAVLGYEALKDVHNYANTLALILGYRLLLWRWQGEASELAAPDERDVPAAAAAAPGDAIAPPAEPVPAPRPERLLVRKLGKEFLLEVAEVEWVQACGNYVNLHRRGHDYPLRATLSGFEQRLDPAQFARIHRSWLVRLAQIDRIEPTESGDARVVMRDGSQLPCSRSCLDALRQQLQAG